MRCLFRYGLRGLVLFGIVGLPFQKVATKVSVYNDIFLTDAGLLPLPKNAIELERDFTIKSDLFHSPLNLAADPQGNIYASSQNNHAVCKFNAAGEFQLQLGTNEEGKSVFQGPSDLVAAKDYLLIHETGRKRLEFVSYHGAHLRSRKMPEFHDVEVDRNGRLYIAPYVVDRNSPLVKVDTPDGRELAFGKPLSFHHSLTTLNSRTLALNEKGELFVAFTYFPIVRKYSFEGTLLAEFRIESPIMEAKETYNLRMIGEGIADVGQRGNFRALIIALKASAEKIYLLSHIPRLEITEMDGDGNGTATYWMDFQEIYVANDFLIRDIDGEKKFYVSHSSPPKFEIDVFKIKKRAQGGLSAEIDDLTDEIAAYPGHFLAYNNRGAARHRLGDYRGALEDFTKAIELAPDSAIAYNNRGLSRVKMKDFEGAISDFTKALELDRNVAAVVFNRGIARAHKNDFEKAIGDFELAAKLDAKFAVRAREQIDYCRGRLKKKEIRRGPPGKMPDETVRLNRGGTSAF